MRGSGSETAIRKSTALSALLFSLKTWGERSLACTVLLLISAMAIDAQRPRAMPVQVSDPQWSSHPMSAAEPSPAGDDNRTINGYMRRGEDYLAGRGVPRDPAQAVYWFRKAAEQGNPGAQNQMGYFTLYGIGVARDENAAASWFIRAVGGGSRLAKLNLGVLYLSGTGVARDPTLAANLFRELAAKGDLQARGYLGVLYYTGVGVTQDRALSAKCFKQAARKHSPERDYAMGILLTSTATDEAGLRMAAEYLRRASGKGFVPAESALGILLVRHPELVADSPKDGVALLQHAAESGKWEGSAALGVLARDGFAGQRNMAEAFRWFTIAGRQGGAEAEARTRDDLAQCREVLTGDQQNQQLQQAESWLAQHPERDTWALKSGTRAPAGRATAGAD